MFTHSGLSVSGSQADVEGTADSRWCFNLAEKRRMQLRGLRLKQTHLHSKLVRASILTVSGKGIQESVYSLQPLDFSMVAFFTI